MKLLNPWKGKVFSMVGIKWIIKYRFGIVGLGRCLPSKMVKDDFYQQPDVGADHVDKQLSRDLSRGIEKDLQQKEKPLLEFGVKASIAAIKRR